MGVQFKNWGKYTQTRRFSNFNFSLVDPFNARSSYRDELVNGKVIICYTVYVNKSSRRKSKILLIFI